MYAHVRELRKSKIQKIHLHVRGRSRTFVLSFVWSDPHGRTDMMKAPRPPQPPVMKLIQERRTRRGLSFRAAGTAAGISEARWRQLESGSRDIRGVHVEEPAPDKTLARMAYATGVTPQELKDHDRPEAAQLLEDYAAERTTEDVADTRDAARLVDQLGRGLTARQRAALEEEIAEALRRSRDR